MGWEYTVPFVQLRLCQLEKVKNPSLGFYSRFLVQKVPGGWRPVIRVVIHQQLGYLILMPFKMEIVSSVLGSIKKGNVIFSVDLKDVCFDIPVPLDSCPYLRIAFSSRVFQFRALCFGLSIVPQVFARVFTLVSEWAYKTGIRLLCYLNSSCPLQYQEFLLLLCCDLGIVINVELLDFEPTNRAQYLRMLRDTIQEIVLPTDSEISKF